ncbi:hypothetical protein NL676_017254 [Syzygium grande]|nr:hypothetical protein NL676_017254 [Syzygium grande]
MASLPTFSYSAWIAFAAKHGLAIQAITIEVEDANATFRTSVAPMAPGRSPHRSSSTSAATIAEVHLYGDVVLHYVSYKTPASDRINTSPASWFLPRFELTDGVSSFLLDFESEA